MAIHDDMLRSHLDTLSMLCTTYVSPRVQNELIAVMGKHMILKGVLDELKAALYYSILADEVTSHNVEHLAICASLVDKKKTSRRNFCPSWS